MNSKRIATVLSSTAAAVLLAGTLAGCDSFAAPRETVTADDLVSRQPAPSGPVDEIVWNLTAGEPVTLDPRNAVSYSSGQVVANLCDYLLTIDENFEVHPNLADVEQTSPTEIVITLRDDATFWDGSPVTADDVAYSLQRSADPELSTVAFVFAAVSAIEVTGANEVTVSFSEPDSLFLRGLSTITGAVLKKDWAESVGDEVGTATGGLMCSGPYQLGAWKSGSELVLEANTSYWNPDRMPLAKTVRFTVLTDVTAVVQALSAGEIDGSYELPASTVPTLSGSSEGELVFGPSTQTVTVAVARPETVLDDRKLLQGLQMAFDREAMAGSVFNGAAQPSYTVVGSTTWPSETRDLYAEAAEQWKDARTYDPEAAKSLIEESSYDGSPLRLAVAAGDETLSKAAQLIQQQAKAVGVDIRIDTISPLLMSQAAYDPAAREDMDLMLSSSFNSTPDPLEPMLFTYLPDEAYNYTGFDEPAVTEGLFAARAEFDPEAKAKLVIEAQELTEASNDTIPLVETVTTTFVNKRLTGAITSFAYWSMPQMAFIGAAD